MSRSTRNQPFCWQEKKILRLFRIMFKGNELAKFRNLYGTITEMDSDFNSQDIKFYTKTISTYSGLSEDWIPKGLKKLQELKIIMIVADRVNGKFKGKRLIFTPENIDESICDTITVKSTNGKFTNGFLESSEDISLLEDSILQEETNNYMVDTVNQYEKALPYKNKTEFIQDINQYELTSTVKDILELFYNSYLETTEYNHYKLKDIDLHICIENLKDIERHIDEEYKNKLSAITVMKNYTYWYFDNNDRYNIKNFARIKAFNFYFTKYYKKYLNTENYYSAKTKELIDSYN